MRFLSSLHDNLTMFSLCFLLWLCAFVFHNVLCIYVTICSFFREHVIFCSSKGQEMKSDGFGPWSSVSLKLQQVQEDGDGDGNGKYIFFCVAEYTFP